MKKKIIASLLCLILVLPGCGASPKNEAAEQPAESSIKTTVPEETSDETVVEGSSSTLDAIGDIDVEQELFDVMVTVPAEFMEDATQEDLDAAAAEYGYKITLNEDGSATYTMTHSQHEAMMEEMSASIYDSLVSMVGSEDYPNITDISVNDDFTKYTITTTNTEPDLSESLMVISLYTYSGFYHVFNGTTVDNVHVDFVNTDSGEIISSSDSSDMNKAAE